MELKAHFSQIHKVIIGHLSQAQYEIVAAIAWFTDRDIFDVLCAKAREGVIVSIALIGDKINQGPGALNFHRLTNFGGRVIFLPPGSRDEPVMHHKFCVIDASTVITGSYNWSQKARSNDENITVVSDASDFAAKFLVTFDSILDRASHAPSSAVDSEAVRRRLEVIRNMILLGEQEQVPFHLRKLRPVSEALRLSRIIAALDNGAFKTALEEIDVFMRKSTALVEAGLVDVTILRLQLEALELRLASLTEEKAELERRLIVFNRRYDDTLGELVRRVLQARAQKAKLFAAEQTPGNKRKVAEAAAFNAEIAYERYSQRHGELQHEEPIPELDEGSEGELKILYRKACRLCHPDKVCDTKKEEAHRVFVDLQGAYKSSNLSKVREIHDMLTSGESFETRSIALGQADLLRAAVAELDSSINGLVFELKAMYESNGVKLMNTAGLSESGWQAFFEIQRSALNAELSPTEMAL